MAEEAKADAAASSSPLDVLTQVLKEVNKDSLQAFQVTRAIEGTSFPATLMAYRALRRAAEFIAERVTALNASPVLVQSGEDVSDLSEYRTFLPRLDALIAGIQKDIEVAAGALAASPPRKEFAFTAGLAGAAVSAALAIGGAIFHREIKSSFSSVTIEDDTCAFLVANVLRKNGVDFRLSNAFSLEFSGATGKEPADRLMDRLRLLQDNAQKLQEQLGAVEQLLGPPETQPRDSSKPRDPEKERLAGIKHRLEQSAQAVKSFADAFAPVAHRMLRADEKQAFLKQRGALLMLHVLVGGGGTRTEASTFGRDRIEHSGGVIVRYSLINTQGKVVEADIVAKHGRAEEKDSHLEAWRDP
jgi:hypothetical protein